MRSSRTSHFLALGCALWMSSILGAESTQPLVLDRVLDVQGLVIAATHDDYDGDGRADLIVLATDNLYGVFNAEIYSARALGSGPFIRCDSNADGRPDIADAVWILNALFRDGPRTLCPAAADCDADGQVAVPDAIYLVAYRFLDGPPPAAPFPTCDRVPGMRLEDCPPRTTACP